MVERSSSEREEPELQPAAVVDNSRATARDERIHSSPPRVTRRAGHDRDQLLRASTARIRMHPAPDLVAVPFLFGSSGRRRSCAGLAGGRRVWRHNFTMRSFWLLISIWHSDQQIAMRDAFLRQWKIALPPANSSSAPPFPQREA